MRVDPLLMSSLLLSDPTSLIRADKGDNRPWYGSDHYPLLLEFSVKTDARPETLPPPPAGLQTPEETNVSEQCNMSWDAVRSCSEVCAELRAALGSYAATHTGQEVNDPT